MAKKSKSAKRSASGKAVKKPVVRSSSSKKKKATVKKAIPKKAAAKKPAAKKVVAKPAARKGKKAVPKKVAVKKSAPKKSAAKKATVKKVVTKKVTVKKAAAKKPPVKKVAAAKVAAKPVSPVVKKKTVLVKRPRALVIPIPAAVSLPPVEEQSEDLVGKAANLDAGNGLMLPGSGSTDALRVTEDPIKTFDKNVFNKATAKGNPHSNLQFSSKPKNAVKPSGKKPLWNK